MAHHPSEPPAPPVYFESGGATYAVDMNQHVVVEVDDVVKAVLERRAIQSDEEIARSLQERHSLGDILEALDYVRSLAESNVFADIGHEIDARELREDSARPWVLCPTPDTFVTDALHHLLAALGRQFAYVDVCASRRSQLSPGIHAIPFNYGTNRASHARHAQYDAMFLESFRDASVIPALSRQAPPVVVPAYVARGSLMETGGSVPNLIFLWYAAFRGYDAFLVPSRFARDYYTRYLTDVECFHVSPYGVEHERFFPIDKREARRRVAEITADERVLTMPIVGFLSRLQPEKGGGVYIQLARRIPDALFLAVAPTLTFYEGRSTPDNFLYAGEQPRELLPLFFNAFDMHVFPSVVDQETFGMVALEAMACGTPVVASDFDGIPEVVGDTGILVSTVTHDREIGSIVGHVDIEALETAVRDLLDHPDKRRNLGHMAHERSRGSTWDRSARDLAELFEELKRRQSRAATEAPYLDVRFTPTLDADSGRPSVQAVLAGVASDKRKLLMFESYIQSPEEGLALALLKSHTWHEVEAILREFCGREGAQDVVRRVRQFLQTLSI